MKRSHPVRVARHLITPVVGSAAALALLVFASINVAQADSTSTNTLTQQALMATGTASSTSGGVAVPGAAVAYTVPIVVQDNIQVIAGDAATKANSSQNASNTVTGGTTAAAVSGDASAADGAVASSGSAVAGTMAFIMQMNIQVIAGNGCSITQDASNSYDLNQTAAAATGDASATGGGSSATSGGANAMGLAIAVQTNVQVYVCRNGTTGQQTASNVGGADQLVGSLTRGSSASGGGSAGSGNSTSQAWNLLHQSNLQTAYY
jgi:hypothetical protein